MQIIKLTAIIAAMIIAAMGIESQTVQATSDDVFKVRITLEGVDSQTGQLKIILYGNDGIQQTQIVDPFADGRAGNVPTKVFKLPASSVRQGESFSLCVHSLDYDNADECITGENTPNKKIEEVSIKVPSGIGRAGDTTYYDEEPDNEDVTEVSQGADSNAVDNNQGTGVTVSIGDDSDNNNITVDQRTTFGDVVRELLPIAKKAGSAVKNTAVEIFN